MNMIYSMLYLYFFYLLCILLKIVFEEVNEDHLMVGPTLVLCLLRPLEHNTARFEFKGMSQNQGTAINMTSSLSVWMWVIVDKDKDERNGALEVSSHLRRFSQ